MSNSIIDQVNELSQSMINALLLAKLNEIDKKVTRQLPYLTVDEAINSFKEYLSHKKRPGAYTYTLEQFNMEFSGRNIAEINAEEIEGFIASRWSSSKDNTIRGIHAQLSGLFNHAIKMLMRKGSPVFNNPMVLIERPSYHYTEIEFIPVEQMKKTLDAAKNNEKHWLAIAMMVSTGMRSGELLKLVVKDKQGQILTIREPKSGNKEEWVILPEIVERRLNDYIKRNNLNNNDRIIKINANNLNVKVVQRYSKKAGVQFKPHYLRKWIATFWNRQKDNDMKKIVLRHRTSQGLGGNLQHIYIAALSQDEVKERIRILEDKLFK